MLHMPVDFIAGFEQLIFFCSGVLKVVKVAEVWMKFLNVQETKTEVVLCFHPSCAFLAADEHFDKKVCKNFSFALRRVNMWPKNSGIKPWKILLLFIMIIFFTSVASCTSLQGYAVIDNGCHCKMILIVNYVRAELIPPNAFFPVWNCIQFQSSHWQECYINAWDEELVQSQWPRMPLIAFWMNFFFVQVFVNFAKQQTGEDDDVTLHRQTARKVMKVSPVKRK